MHSVSAAILAGGQSRRLGVNKAFVKVAGIPLIERVLRVIASLSEDVLIVTQDLKRYQHLGTRLVSDAFPGGAALGGIYTGLLTARYDQALVVGCDMPFLNSELLRYMIALASEHPVVMPAYEGYLEPLHAIYHKDCLKPMRALLEAGERQIAKAICQVPMRYVTSEEIARFDRARLSFFNINTEQDLALARQIAQQANTSGKDLDHGR